jgi:hypothetical protein
VLLLPIAAVCAVLFTDSGIEPALFYAAVKTFAILFVVVRCRPVPGFGRAS